MEAAAYFVVHLLKDETTLPLQKEAKILMYRKDEAFNGVYSRWLTTVQPTCFINFDSFYLELTFDVYGGVSSQRQSRF